MHIVRYKLVSGCFLSAFSGGDIQINRQSNTSKNKQTLIGIGNLYRFACWALRNYFGKSRGPVISQPSLAPEDKVSLMI